MKRLATIVLAGMMMLSLVSCSDKERNEDRAEKTDREFGQGQENNESLDLSGQWKQVNSDSDDYYGAIISGSTIEVYKVYYEDDSRFLFWSGSFEAPTVQKETYSWDSKNDTEKTELSLVASQEGIKSFVYENGTITFPVIRGDDLLTVQMEKEMWADDLGPGEFDEVIYFPFSIGGVEFLIPSDYSLNEELNEEVFEDNKFFSGGSAFSLTISSTPVSVLVFYEIENSGLTEKDFDENKDKFIRSAAGIDVGEEELLVSKNTSLAGLSAKFIACSFPDNDARRQYITLAFNANVDKILFIQLVVPSGEKDYISYYNHIVNSAKLVETEAPTDTTPVSGIRPEFKEAMDSYEAFFDEYIAFMEGFSDSEFSLDLLTEYSKFMEQYTETMEAMEEWNTEDMSTEEEAYYLEVQTRINDKLMNSAVG